MRVLLVGVNFAPEPTGIAPYTTRIASGLAERGHDVRVVTTYPHYPQWRIADGYSGLRRHEYVDGIGVQRLKHYVPSRPVGSRRALSELSFGVHALSARWGSPDVVVCPSPALLSSAMVQLRSRVAFGLQIQDLYSAGVSETAGGGGAVVRALTAVERRTARRADGIAVIHDRFKTRVVSDLGVPSDRVTVIRNWTHLRRPLTESDPAPARLALGWGDDFVVLHTGAMGEKQGLSNVVETARLADARGLPVRFVLMGDGGQRPSLEVSATGVRSLEFVDPLPDDMYLQALQAADALLVNERPGVTEMAVPSKLTSYFSTGRPVIAATGAGSTTAEELAASGAGDRVDAGDPAALLVAVERLRADPGRAAALGANGPVYCDRVLSESAALDAYDGWVHELVDRHRNS
jgi:glycosyltransferase involved in cell wall biosynthesis